MLWRLGLPHVGQQFFEVGLDTGEPFQHVAKISPHVQLVSMRVSHDRQDGRRPFLLLRHASWLSIGTRVAEESCQSFPVSVQVVQPLTKHALGGSWMTVGG